MDIQNLTKLYSARVRPAVLERDPKDIFLIGFGGTISSGYSPQLESIRPLHPSPAIKQIEYIKLFGIHEIEFSRIDLKAKDSRQLTDDDMFELLDAVVTAPETLILITAGTYMLPKIAELVATCLSDLPKIVVLTGSILPAGFMASDADANVWSALTIGFEAKRRLKATLQTLQTKLVFHGRVFETLEEFQTANFHPPKTQRLIIQYPLSTIPTDYVDQDDE